MAEYYVNPNVAYAAEANEQAVIAGNPAPAANPMPYPVPSVVFAAKPYAAGLSMEAVLVLFTLLVVVTRICR